MKNLFLILVVVILVSIIVWKFDVFSDGSKIDTEKEKLDAEFSHTFNNQQENLDIVKENGTPQKESQSYSEFDYLSLDEKINIKHQCSEYFYNFKNNIDSMEVYKTEYFKVNNVKPTDIQLNALRKTVDYCNKYVSHRAAIENLFIQQQDFGGEKYRKELTDLAKRIDIDNAISVARDGLFDLDSHARLGSLQFLVGMPEWVTSLNEELNINNGYSESKSLIVGAHQMRMCEINIMDCSAGSTTMLNLCVNIPEACGHNLNEYTLWTLTGFEIEYINEYLNYLRTLGG